MRYWVCTGPSANPVCGDTEPLLLWECEGPLGCREMGGGGGVGMERLLLGAQQQLELRGLGRE